MTIAPLRLGPRHRVMLGLAGSALLFLALVRWVYLPVVGRMRERIVAIQDVRVKIADARVVLPKLPAQEAASQEVTQRFEAFQRRVGTEEALANILETLRRDAERLHLAFQASQVPHEETAQRAMMLGPNMVLKPVPVTVSLVGRYRSVGEFLGGLAELPYVLRVESLSVKQPPDLQPRLEATVSVAVYLVGGS